MTDAVVVGLGGGGAVAAYELARAGLQVVALEAGRWHRDVDAEFTRREWSMFNGLDGTFRWGPADPSARAWPRTDDGCPVLLQTAGVGGNTLHYIGNSPRAYPSAIDDMWPIDYADLVPYYERVEEILPVREPERIARRDELFVAGCEKIGLPYAPGRDVNGLGWRLQPNAVGANCTDCGHCLIGCAMPSDASLEEKAKRGTNVSYAPLAEATGRCEIRTECFAIGILTDAGEARGVRYRRVSRDIEEIEAPVVVLAGGAIETPRLWLNSGLPTGTPVGRYFTTHYPDFVCGVAREETDAYKGMQVLTRAEFPGDGFIEPIGNGPLNFGLTNFAGEGAEVADDDPWTTRGMLLGPELERRMEAYTRTLVLTFFVDDEEHPDNRITLGEASDEHGRVPHVFYRPTPETLARRHRLARKAAEILIAAGCDPDTIHRADLPNSTIHQHGTMRMGRDPATSVVDDACEAHQLPGLYVADCSVLPNGIGGPNPTLTAQALATRTTEKIVERTG